MANSKVSALPSATTPLAGTEVLPVVQGGITEQVSVANLTAGRSVSASQLLVNGTNGELIRLSVTSDPAVQQELALGFATGASSTHPAVKISALEFDASDSRASLLFYTRDTNSDVAPTERLRISNAGDVTVQTGNVVQGTAAKGINFTANTPAAGMTSQLLNWYEEGTWTPSVGGTATYTNRSGNYTRTGNRVTCTGSVTINVLGTGSAVVLGGLPYATVEFTSVLVGYFANLATSVYWVSGYSAGDTNIRFTCTTATATTATESFNIFGNAARVDFVITYRV